MRSSDLQAAFGDSNVGGQPPAHPREGEKGAPVRPVFPNGQEEGGGLPAGLKVLLFSVSRLLIYLRTKWRIVLGVFLSAFIMFFMMERSLVLNSDLAYTARAKVLHQATTGLRTYHKDISTDTVLEFLGSQNVQTRVREKLTKMEDVAFTNLSRADFSPSLFQNIVISRIKKSPFLIVEASAKTADMAAVLANEIAKEGVKEYTEFLNREQRGAIAEHASQSNNLVNTLDNLAGEKLSLRSPKTLLSPDVELAQKNALFSAVQERRDAMQEKLLGIDITIRELETMLDITPELEENEKRVDNTKTVGLEGKKSELRALLERYTEKNPKVIVLRGEIARLEEQQANSNLLADIVIMRKNPVYSSLKAQLVSAQIEKTTTMETLKMYDTNMFSQISEIQELAKNCAKYEEIERREEVVRTRLENLSAKIDELNFAISSAVPELTILEQATPPKISNVSQRHSIVIVETLVVTFGIIFVLALLKILKMQLTASSEYEAAIQIRDIGELPTLTDFSQEVRSSALQRIIHNLRREAEGVRAIGVLNFSSIDAIRSHLKELTAIELTSGQKNFYIHCVPATNHDNVVINENVGDDSLASELLIVKKKIDIGYVLYQNPRCLDDTEMNMLKFDIESLLNADYDTVFVLIDCDSGEDMSLLMKQLAELVGYIVIVAKFEKVKKTAVLNQVKNIKECSQCSMGGILTDIPRMYYGY